MAGVCHQRNRRAKARVVVIATGCGGAWDQAQVAEVTLIGGQVCGLSCRRICEVSLNWVANLCGTCDLWMRLVSTGYSLGGGASLLAAGRLLDIVLRLLEVSLHPLRQGRWTKPLAVIGPLAEGPPSRVGVTSCAVIGPVIEFVVM